ILAFSFALIPLACLLPGEANRRGLMRRVLLAVGVAFVFQSADIGIRNLANRYGVAIPLIYLTDLLPIALGFGILMRSGIKFGARSWPHPDHERDGKAVAGAACQNPLGLHRPPVLRLVLRRVRGDGGDHLPRRLHRAAAP